MNDKIGRASGLGRGIMSGITSASRADEIRRQMMEDDSDSDLSDLSPTKKSKTGFFNSESEEEIDKDVDPSDQIEEEEKGIEEEPGIVNPQHSKLQERITVSLTRPSCLFDFSKREHDGIIEWVSASLACQNLSDIMMNIFADKEKCYNAMEHRVITSYMVGKLAPNMNESVNQTEFASVSQMLAFLVYFSNDDAIAELAYRTFCDIDHLVVVKYGFEMDLHSNLSAIFRFYGASFASFPAPILACEAREKVHQNEYKSSLIETYFSLIKESVENSSMDSVTRFLQSLKVFCLVMKQQIKLFPKSLTRCRKSICIDVLSILSDVMSYTFGQGEAESPLRGQGRHSEVGVVLEDILVMCISDTSDQLLASVEEIIHDLYERDQHRFNFSVRAIVALRKERLQLMRAIKCLCQDVMEMRLERAFETFHGVSWKGADPASEGDIAMYLADLMEIIQGKLSGGPRVIDFNEVESVFFIAHSFLVSGVGPAQTEAYREFKKVIHACESVIDCFDDVDKTLQGREEFISCKRVCSELTDQVQAFWGHVEQKRGCF